MAVPLVLITEDDPTWQDIFTEIVADAGFKPVVVSTYQNAVRALESKSFVLAVVDISLSLPDHDDRGGVDVLREIAKLSAPVPAIVVTGYATIDLAIETLAELNAAYFFKKEEFNRREFIRMVKEKAATNSLAQILSKREYEVLLLMSQGYTNHEIAEQMTVTVNTVKKHAQNIFTKLNVNSRAAAVAKLKE